jgi:hypothetical protein
MVVLGDPVTNYPYILFNKSPEQLRRLGASGGKAQARNRRARLQAPVQAQPQRVEVSSRLAETVVDAIAALDAQFPWLRGAEWKLAKRKS